MSCIFCSILEGTAPASVVYEDEAAIVIMDIRPTRPGQLVIVPREHIDHFADLPDELAGRLFLLGQRIARAMRRALNPRRVGMIVHGLGVRHAHLAVLPLEHAWDITAAQFSYIENGEVRFRPYQVALAPRAELDSLAARLREALSA